MPHPDAPPLTRGVVLRSVGFAVAIALGAVAVWLIVIADTTKSMRIGVLAGIWGALLGAYSMFGARRHGLDADEQLQRSLSDVPVLSAQEIAVRSSNDVERVAEAAARRAFEDRLEQMLRRELSREVSDLRSEIARLRQDLLDKVGGQLRLERIETTRVIGSDLEALQHEVRQLKQASETGTLHELGLGSAPLRTVVEPAKVRPISRASAEAAADVKPARSADEPRAAAPVAPAAAEAVPEPVAHQPARTQPTSEPVRPPAPAAPAAPAAPWTPPATAPAPVTRNGASGNGASPNGATSKVAPAKGASPNGASPNGASPNGASSNGAARRPDAPRDSAPPKPVETTGPIRLQPPESIARAETSGATARRPATPRPAEPQRPREVWSPPAPPARPQATERPPAAPVPPAAATRLPSGDPFASLPRITPFTEFELDPVDTTTHVDEPRSAAPTAPPAPTAPSAPASPVAPSDPAYTGRRRRTDGAGQDAGRHSRSEPAAAPPATSGGRRRRDVEDDVEDDLLSRLLARGAAER